MELNIQASSNFENATNEEKSSSLRKPNPFLAGAMKKDTPTLGALRRICHNSNTSPVKGKISKEDGQIATKTNLQLALKGFDHSLENSGRSCLDKTCATSTMGADESPLDSNFAPGKKSSYSVISLGSKKFEEDDLNVANAHFQTPQEKFCFSTTEKTTREKFGTITPKSPFATGLHAIGQSSKAPFTGTQWIGGVNKLNQVSLNQPNFSANPFTHSQSQQSSKCSLISSDRCSASVSSISYQESNWSESTTLKRIHENFGRQTHSKQYVDENLIPEVYEEDEKMRIIDQQRKNLLVPEDKFNDERFKVLTIAKKIRKESLPPNKSARKFSEASSEWQKDMENAIEYATLKKRKVSHSTKKNFASILNLTNTKNEVKPFALFFDNQLKINEYWQAPLIPTTADEDVNTDEDQLQLADSYTKKELIEAIQMWQESGWKTVRNYKLINPEFEDVDEELDWK